MQHDSKQYTNEWIIIGDTEETKTRREQSTTPLFWCCINNNSDNASIMLFLSWNDGLNFTRRQMNKYFNKLSNKQLCDHFIFDSIKSSLLLIQQRTKHIKHKIEEKEQDKNNESRLFISHCGKNEMFDQFVYIVEKVQLVNVATLPSFMNLWAVAAGNLLCVRIPQYHNGQMFVRKTDSFDSEQYEECKVVWIRIRIRKNVKTNDKNDKNDANDLSLINAEGIQEQ